MREKFTRFDCDQCSERVIIKDDAGFPYDKGWNYIYNINGKASNNPTSKIQDAFKQFEEKDKHFCSKQCVMQYVQNLLRTDFNSEVNKPATPKEESYHDLERPQHEDIPNKLKYESFDESQDEPYESSIKDTRSNHKPLRAQRYHLQEKEEYEEPKPPQDTSNLQKPEPKKKRKGLFRW